MGYNLVVGLPQFRPIADYGPELCTPIPRALIPLLIGYLNHLNKPDVWTGTPQERALSATIVDDFIVSLMMASECDPVIGDNGDKSEIKYICVSGDENEILEELGIMAVQKLSFDCETNELVIWYGGCCEERISLACLTTAIEPPPEIWDDFGDPVTGAACGKVWSMINAFSALSDTAWQYWNDPGIFEQRMREAVPNAQLSRARIWQWPPTLYLWDQFYDGTIFTSNDVLALAACQAVANVSDNPDATFEEVGYVVSSLASAMSQLVGPSIGVETWWSYWEFIRQTIGARDCRHIMSLGATDTTSTCDCPDDTDTGYAGTLQFSSFLTDLGTNGSLEFAHLDNGRILDITWTKPNGTSQFAWFRYNMVASGPIESVKYRIAPVSGFRMCTDGQYPRGEYPPLVQYYPDVGAMLLNSTPAKSSQPTYLEITETNANGPGGLNQYIEIDTSQAPWAVAHSGVYRWTVEIVEIDGVSLIG